MTLPQETAAEAPFLVVEGLVKRFGRQVVLDDVSLAVDAGTVYGLAGPNGGGKSILLRIVATLERPTAGRVRVMGYDAVLEPAAVRTLVGYAGPSTGTPALTVAEELDLTAQLRGIGVAERRDTVGAMLQLVDLYERRHRPVSQLSVGDRKRLALARSLVHDPALLLLDCPFDGLDGAARGELRAVLVELAAMGKALVVTGSTVAELSGLCHEVGLLDRGRLLLSGPPEHVLTGGEIGRPMRLTLAAGMPIAKRLLSAHPAVSAVVEGGENVLLFRIDGDAAAQARLVAELVEAGTSVAELTAAQAEAEADLNRLVRAS